jgi:hypothetical protein
VETAGIRSGLDGIYTPAPVALMVFLGMCGEGLVEFGDLVWFGKYPESANDIFVLAYSK